MQPRRSIAFCLLAALIGCGGGDDEQRGRHGDARAPGDSASAQSTCVTFGGEGSVTATLTGGYPRTVSWSSVGTECSGSYGSVLLLGWERVDEMAILLRISGVAAGATTAGASGRLAVVANDTTDGPWETVDGGCTVDVTASTQTTNPSLYRVAGTATCSAPLEPPPLSTEADVNLAGTMTFVGYAAD